MLSACHSFKALAVGLLIAVPSPGFAQSAAIGVYDHANGSLACFAAPGQSALVRIVLKETLAPIKTARFTLYTPCGPSIPYNLTFSPCITAGATMVVTLVSVPAGCADVHFKVEAIGGPKIELTDCDGYSMTGGDAIRHGGYDTGPCIEHYTVAPYQPTPANGSTNMPTNVLLSYVGPATTIEMSTEPLADIRFFNADEYILCAPTESPYPVEPCSYPVNPGTLVPHTTYYWRAVNYSYNPYMPIAFSDVFSFTTGDGPVATEQATWGRVKAMYRE